MQTSYLIHTVRAFKILPLALLGWSIAHTVNAKTMLDTHISDKYAWEKVVEMATPSKTSTTNQLEFETWADDNTVYKDEKPQWPVKNAAKKVGTSFLNHSRTREVASAVLSDPCLNPQESGLIATSSSSGTKFPPGTCVGEEVRRNKISFDYIVGNHLNTQTGLAKAYENKFKVVMPPGAIAFKGDWAAVSDIAKWLSTTESVVRENYFLASAEMRGVQTEIALISFRLMAKRGPSWVWSEFEASLNPGRCDGEGCVDVFGAITKHVSANQYNHKSYSECKKSPELLKLFKDAGVPPVWEKYCLYGSQISFEDSDGKPTVLGKGMSNRLSKEQLQANTSCINCHAYASFNKSGVANSFASAANLPVTPNGQLDMTFIKDYLTNDFTWGLSQARK